MQHLIQPIDGCEISEPTHLTLILFKGGNVDNTTKNYDSTHSVHTNCDFLNTASGRQ